MTRITRRAALRFATTSLFVPAGLLSADSAEQGTLKFELYRDSKERIRWRLKAANGKVIATSGAGYQAKADCRNAIDLIKRGAGSATVEDLT
jgi:uncharacterized protein YegP (UPF0339 family)